MTISAPTSVNVRDVTEEEREHVKEHGWVFLPRLIEPATAGLLLEHAKKLMGDTGDDFEQKGNRDQTVFSAYDHPSKVDELFASVMLHPKLGRNGALLMGADVSVRVLNDNVIAKLPSAKESTKAGKGISPYHQDLGSFPMRGDHIAFWIALTEVTPEMGAMRYYDGSHKLGWLAGDPLDWPDVHRCPLSDPFHYQPGDATAHRSQMVHGAPLNTTSNPRWAYLLSYFPANAQYTGAVSHWTKDATGDLQPGKPFDHPDFPIAYEPAPGN